MFTHLAHHARHDSTGYDKRIQNKTHNCCEPTKAQGSKAKPASRVSTAQSKQSEGESDTKAG
jgi:hypothetical protein